jgi:threonine/homoserine/homoserine lactone efflux protein
MPTFAVAIDGRAAGALLLAALAIMGSPGPATISLTALGSAYGVRRSLGYLAGIIVGTTVVLLAVATGLTATLLALSALHAALIAVSAAYILWLAYHIATAPPFVADFSGSQTPTLSGGLLLGVANPKAWVAIAAVFAGATLNESAAIDAAAKIALLTGTIIVINTSWLLAGAALAPLLRDARRARIINCTLAAALVAAMALTIVS